MPVQKVVVEAIVFLEAESPEAARIELENQEPACIMARCDDGDAVGSFKIQSITQLTQSEIASELQAVGSDISFFPDAEAGDYLASARVNFDVPIEADTDIQFAATATMENFVENDDLIGQYEIEGFSEITSDKRKVSAILRFRTQGDSISDATAFAESRLEEILQRAEFINGGKIISVEDDLA